MAEVSAAKKRSIIAYRKKKDLCTLCGCVKEGSEHVCYENYVRADMREERLRKADVIEIHGQENETDNSVVPTLEDVSENESNVMPELDARVKTVISYRRRKKLCVKCGAADADTEHDCDEDYTEADRRSEDEKKADPRTVITPKEKMPTIEEQNVTEQVNNEFRDKYPDPFFRMDKTEDVEAQRKFILIDINRSVSGQKFSVDYLQFMTSKHKNMIVYIIGQIDSVYSFKESDELKKISNLCPIKNILDQNIVNHLHCCERFFGFPSKYITYSMCYNIPCTVFFDNSEKYDIPCNVVDVKNDQDVTRDIVSINTLSWKI